MPRQDKYFVPIGQFFDTIWEAVKKKETLFIVRCMDRMYHGGLL